MFVRYVCLVGLLASPENIVTHFGTYCCQQSIAFGDSRSRAICWDKCWCVALARSSNEFLLIFVGLHSLTFWHVKIMQNFSQSENYRFDESTNFECVCFEGPASIVIVGEVHQWNLAWKNHKLRVTFSQCRFPRTNATEVVVLCQNGTGTLAHWTTRYSKNISFRSESYAFGTHV